MKWPLLDVPASATVKDTRSPSPAHLVSPFLLKAWKGHSLSCPMSLPPPSHSSSKYCPNCVSRMSRGTAVRVLPVHAPITATSARAHTTRDVVRSETPALPLAGDPRPPLLPLHLSSGVLHSLLSRWSSVSSPRFSCRAAWRHLKRLFYKGC